MSQIKVCADRSRKSLDVETIFDVWAIDGGLDLNDIKKEDPISLDLRNLSYTFPCSDGFSIGAKIYWVLEDDQPRQFVWIECAIGELSGDHSKLMRHLLDRSREIPAAFKFGLSDELIVLCLRGAADSFSTLCLKELVEGIIPCAGRLYQEMKENFDLPTWAECRAVERRAASH